jgi:hypothetical protein
LKVIENGGKVFGDIIQKNWIIFVDKEFPDKKYLKVSKEGDRYVDRVFFLGMTIVVIVRLVGRIDQEVMIAVISAV